MWMTSGQQKPQHQHQPTCRCCTQTTLDVRRRRARLWARARGIATVTQSTLTMSVTFGNEVKLSTGCPSSSWYEPLTPPQLQLPSDSVAQAGHLPSTEARVYPRSASEVGVPSTNRDRFVIASNVCSSASAVGTSPWSCPSAFHERQPCRWGRVEGQ